MGQLCLKIHERTKLTELSVNPSAKDCDSLPAYDQMRVQFNGSLSIYIIFDYFCKSTLFTILGSNEKVYDYIIYASFCNFRILTEEKPGPQCLRLMEKRPLHFHER